MMKHWSHCSEDIGLLESMFLQQTAILLLEDPVRLLLEDSNYASQCCFYSCILIILILSNSTTFTWLSSCNGIISRRELWKLLWIW